MFIHINVNFVTSYKWIQDGQLRGLIVVVICAVLAEQWCVMLELLCAILLRPKINRRLKIIFKYVIFFLIFIGTLHCSIFAWHYILVIHQSWRPRCRLFNCNCNNIKNKNILNLLWKNVIQTLDYISTKTDIIALQNALPVDCVEFAT